MYLWPDGLFLTTNRFKKIQSRQIQPESFNMCGFSTSPWHDRILIRERFVLHYIYSGSLFVSHTHIFWYISILSILTGGKRVLYNLYGVSNHSGGVHSGHYTANCKHPYSGEWNVFNDTRYATIYTMHILPFIVRQNQLLKFKDDIFCFLSLPKPKKPWMKFLFQSAFGCYIYC